MWCFYPHNIYISEEKKKKTLYMKPVHEFTCSAYTEIVQSLEHQSRLEHQFKVRRINSKQHIV